MNEAPGHWLQMKGCFDCNRLWFRGARNYLFSFSFPPPLHSESGLRNSVCKAWRLQPRRYLCHWWPWTSSEVLVEQGTVCLDCKYPEIRLLSCSPAICAGRQERAALVSPCKNSPCQEGFPLRSLQEGHSRGVAHSPSFLPVTRQTMSKALAPFSASRTFLATSGRGNSQVVSWLEGPYATSQLLGLNRVHLPRKVWPDDPWGSFNVGFNDSFKSQRCDLSLAGESLALLQIGWLVGSLHEVVYN